MRKGIIITLIVILSLLAVSATIFLVSALASGGKMNKEWNLGINMGFMDEKNLQIRKEEEFDLTGMEEVRVKLASSDVHIYKSENGKLKVVQKSSNEPEQDELFCSNITNNTISIIENLKVKFKFFSFGTSWSSYDIYVPEEYVGNLTIQTASGSIQIATNLNTNNLTLKSTSGSLKVEKDLTLKENLNLQTTSGSIKIEGKQTANNGTLKSTSGSIQIDKQTEITQVLTISTVSGSIKSEELITANSSKISSTSGSIKLACLITEKDSSFSTVSGGIQLSDFKGYGTLSSTSGSIRVANFDIIGDTNIKSTSGKIELTMAKNANCDIYDKTTSGSVHISNDVRRLGTAPYHILNLKTTSGGISVTN